MMCYMASRSYWISVLLLFYFHFVESNDDVCRGAMFKAATNKGKNNFFVLRVVKIITEVSASLSFLVLILARNYRITPVFHHAADLFVRGDC